MPKEEGHPADGEKAFRGAYIAVHKFAQSLGPSVPLTYEEDYTLEEGLDVDPNTVVGTRTTRSGARDGVAYEIVVDKYDERSGVDTTNDILFNIRINAAEGAEATDVQYDDEKGSIGALVWLHTDGTVFADFGHGTQRSIDPTIQQHLAAIGTAFGVTEEQMYSSTPTTLSTPDEITHFATCVDQLAEDPSVL